MAIEVVFDHFYMRTPTEKQPIIMVSGEKEDAVEKQDKSDREEEAKKNRGGKQTMMKNEGAIGDSIRLRPYPGAYNLSTPI